MVSRGVFRNLSNIYNEVCISLICEKYEYGHLDSWYIKLTLYKSFIQKQNLEQMQQFR